MDTVTTFFVFLFIAPTTLCLLLHVLDRTPVAGQGLAP
jgi:hypothetical protein